MSTMQTTFQDIRRFSACDLSLEQKLKILNFMKRFGKVSLCITIRGYFNVTKKFPVKMQTSFQDIRRFSACDLSLEQKLKILNFMKRFGKVSLCISIRGYFNVTKKFPVKMGNTLHSIFSGLLKLKSATENYQFLH
ncbi:uncharacterized protein [Centruroides vittatus]|uniref:uncharacterized protein n=1 Tax=Centruroides vittatus TaxID=120091 RepID=UPI003510B737